MTRHALRVVLALAVIGCVLVAAGAARAQSTATDLEPNVKPIDQTAFRSQSGLAPNTSQHIAETSPIAAAELFTDLMLRWQASDDDAALLKIEVRASKDGNAWTPWGVAAMSDEPPGADDTADTRWSDAIYAGEARFYQFRLTRTERADGSLPEWSGFEVHTVDARMPNGEQPQPVAPQQSRSSVVEIDAVSMPAYVSRTAWGSPDGQGSRKPPAYRTATHLIVHHTADSANLQGSERNYAERVRAYWSFHALSHGWGDIGYNWIIDPNGVIYEGRSGSPSGDAVGFHDTANYGSMGVSTIGTYTGSAPSAAAQESLVNVLSWKASQRGINPTGSGFYYGCSISNYCINRRGNANLPTIAGHREVTPGHTTCPGDGFMAILPNIKNRVAQRINGGDTTPDNGDLTIDEREPTFSSVGSWKDQACGLGGHTYWTYATNGQGQPSENSGVWRPSVPKAGRYSVYAYIPQGCGIGTAPYATGSARYEIKHASGSANRTVDHNTGEEWVNLGSYSFNAGKDGYIRLTDLTGDPFSAKKVIFFDAIKLVADTTPPDSSVSGSVRGNGVVDLALNSSDSSVTEFEVQARDTSDGSLSLIRSTQRRTSFIGTPGHTYEFRSRATNGGSWGFFPGNAQVTLGVPSSATFYRVAVPRVTR